MCQGKVPDVQHNSRDGRSYDDRHAKAGAEVRSGDLLCTLFADDAERLTEPERMVSEAFEITDAPPRAIPLVHEVLTRDTLSQSPSL